MAAAMMLAVQACNWAPWYLLAPQPPVSAPSEPAPRPTPDPSLPSPTPYPRIDITRQEYDAALAKWEAARILEYEIDVAYNSVYSPVSGVWRLRVTGGRVIDYHRLTDTMPSLPEPDVNSDMLQFLTVEAMFNDIKRVLDDPTSAQITIGGSPFEVQYMVTFDNALGYPRTLGIYPIFVTDNESYTEIRNLTILHTAPSLIPWDIVL
jgi:hypothetical protein